MVVVNSEEAMDSEKIEVDMEVVNNRKVMDDKNKKAMDDKSKVDTEVADRARADMVDKIKMANIETLVITNSKEVAANQPATMMICLARLAMPKNIPADLAIKECSEMSLDTYSKTSIPLVTSMSTSKALFKLTSNTLVAAAVVVNRLILAQWDRLLRCKLSRCSAVVNLPEVDKMSLSEWLWVKPQSFLSNNPHKEMSLVERARRVLSKKLEKWLSSST